MRKSGAVLTLIQRTLAAVSSVDYAFDAATSRFLADMHARGVHTAPNLARPPRIPGGENRPGLVLEGPPLPRGYV